MSTVLERIHTLIDLLSPEQQEQVLVLMQELTQKRQEVSSKSKLPPGTSGKALLALKFSLSPEEVDTMEKAIEEGCERIEPDDNYLHSYFT